MGVGIRKFLFDQEGFGFVLGKDYFGGLGTVFFFLVGILDVGPEAGGPVDGEEKTGDLYKPQTKKKQQNTGYVSLAPSTGGRSFPIFS